MSARNSPIRRGMSILEVLMSLAICAMLLTAVAAAFSSSAQVIDENDKFYRASQSARVTLNQLLTEIRRAHAVNVPSPYRIDLITWNNEDRSYVYSSTAQTLTLVTNGVTTDPDYRLTSDVPACTFTADTRTDEGGIEHVVRVSVAITVQVGDNQIRLSGSAAPRREQSYK